VSLKKLGAIFFVLDFADETVLAVHQVKETREETPVYHFRSFTLKILPLNVSHFIKKC
jgi:hypothetical protein